VQEQCPLGRFKVRNKILHACCFDEAGANHLDLVDGGPHLGFAVRNDTVHHACERLDEFRPGDLDRVQRLTIYQFSAMTG